MKLKLTNISCEKLYNASQLGEKQSPSVKFHIGAAKLKTKRILLGGTNCSFVEIFVCEIDENSYKEGTLEIDAEVIHRGATSKLHFSIGTGKASLKSVIPEINKSVDFSIPLTHNPSNLSISVFSKAQEPVPAGTLKVTGELFNEGQEVFAKELSKHDNDTETSSSLKSSPIEQPPNTSIAAKISHFDPIAMTASAATSIVNTTVNTIATTTGTGTVDKETGDDSNETLLKNTFPDADFGELHEDFYCVVREPLSPIPPMPGRMYVTDNFIVFIGQFFLARKKLRIPYGAVTEILLEKDSSQLEYCLVIRTDEHTYNIKAVWDKDACYEALKDAWTAGKDGGVAKDPNLVKVVDETQAETVSLHNVEDEEVSQLYQKECEKTKKKITAISESTLPISVKQFHDFFLAENCAHSYKFYHEKCKDKNVVVSEWRKPESLGESAGYVVRDIKFFKPVNLPGLASTRGVKNQMLQQFGNHGLILQSSTRLEDVPAADCFTVDDVVQVHAIDATHVKVTVMFEVHFIKSTFLKSMIEGPSVSEMKKWLIEQFKYFTHISEEASKSDGKIAAATTTTIATPAAVTSVSSSESAADNKIVETSTSTSISTFSVTNLLLIILIVVLFRISLQLSEIKSKL